MTNSLLNRVMVSVLIALVLTGACFGGPISSLDDVAYWVGSGTNRAALLLDWDGESTGDQSLAWGYRWDGVATGEDLLKDVLAADARLFAKISAGGPQGIAIYGLGYDSNNDGQFALSDGTPFDADGIAISDPVDGATSSDSNDIYKEGWFLGFWRVGTSTTSPWEGGSWVGAGSGVGGISLVDGHWTSLAFTTDTFSQTAFAENPFSAELPVPDVDFDADHDVDGNDFLVWQRGFGITAGGTHEQGDANHDYRVEDVDFDLWASQFGSWAGGGVLRRPIAAIPEPNCLGLALFAASLWLCLRSKEVRSSATDRTLIDLKLARILPRRLLSASCGQTEVCRGVGSGCSAGLELPRSRLPANRQLFCER